MYYSYQDYLKTAHFRAFAATPSGPREAFSAGWSWNHRTVESAIVGALAGCKKNEKRYIQISACRLHSIGDIKVAGMRKEQLEKAIALYTVNRFATNENFLKLVEVPKTE
jgi:hypothetical protein